MLVDEKRRTIRLLRRAAELTQSEVSECCGFSRSLLASYENGTMDLSPDDLLRVEHVIDEVLATKPDRLVPLNSLLAGSEGWKRLQESHERRGKADRIDRLEEALEQSEAKIQKLEQTISELCATLAEHIGTVGAEAEEGT